MNKFLKSLGLSAQSFLRDEEGAQIIEYALVVAVISIAIILAMKSSLTNNMFNGWLARVQSCLTSTTCT